VFVSFSSHFDKVDRFRKTFLGVGRLVATMEASQRSKHIEVCVRLRPLIVEMHTSSSSFFHNNHPNASTTVSSAALPRKPSIPRPGVSSRLQHIWPPKPQSPESAASSSVDAKVCAWTVQGADTVVQDPATERILGRTYAYTLDRVYGPDCRTQDVYSTSVRERVRAAMDGYHAAILAYGQTATGKTHTMTGTVTEPGLIPLAVRECFAFLKSSRRRAGEYLLRLSYLEVYKEHIKDLLSSGMVVDPPIRLFESGGNLQIRGLKEVVVTSPEQVFATLAEGESRRQVGSTHSNQHSSRSHVLVRLWIESRTSVPGEARESVRVSSLSLVDLAGSESVRLTGSSERRAEGHYINKSLMTLGQVVYALSEASSEEDGAKKQHVPYRDSKLTRLLQPSLSGNAQVVLLCCISPLPSHIEESHNTFKFAIRAKKIPQKAVIQEQSATDETTLLQSYRAEIEDLKQQLKEAQEMQRRQAPPKLDAFDDDDDDDEDDAITEDEGEMKELVEAIQKMEQLILKTQPVTSTLDDDDDDDDLLDVTSQEEGEAPLKHHDIESRLLALTVDPPSTPDRAAAAHFSNGVNRFQTPPRNRTPSKKEGDILHQELARIQGLLGSVLKRRQRGTEAQVRSLRAALEQQEVASSLRRADASFLQAQLEEKDNLLAEVSKLLETVEERQSALETENARLRRELEDLQQSRPIQ
jgi:centromeric protein E